MVYGFAEFCRTCANQFNLLLQDEAEPVDSVEVEGIADGDNQPDFAKADRDYLKSFGICCGDALDYF